MCSDVTRTLFSIAMLFDDETWAKSTEEVYSIGQWRQIQIKPGH